MRQLTEQERAAKNEAMRLYWIKRDGLLPKEYRAFEAGFIAGLSHQDKRIEALEAFIAGKITRAQLDEVTK